MRIPEDTIQEIKGRASIIDVIGEYVRLTPAGRNHKGLCPFHTEKTPSFMVNPQKEIFHCFGCGVGGNVFTFIMKMKGVSFPEAVRMLGERVGVRIDESYDDRDRRELDGLYRANREAAKLFSENFGSPAGEKARRYMKERRCDADLLQTFNVGYAADSWDQLLGSLSRRGIDPSVLAAAGLVVAKRTGRGYYDRFRNRIMFPIVDAVGRTIGFGGRTLDEEKPPKYLNTGESPIFHKGKVLYGLSHAEEAIRKGDRVFIVEGYLDVMRMHQSGFRNTVAPLGTALTEDHAKLISRYTRNIYLIFDADDAGMKAAVRSASLLHGLGIDPFILRLPAGCDPGNFFDRYPVRDFEDMVGDSVPGIDFIIGRFIDGKKRYTAHEKVVIIQRLSEFYAGMSDEIFKDYFLKSLSQSLQLDRPVIERELNRFVKPTRSPSFTPGEDTRRNRKVEAELYLLLLLLNSPDLYPLAASRLDDGHFQGRWTRMLWNTIRKAGEREGWNASTVLSMVEDESFVEYLSGRLMEEVLSHNPREQLVDVIATLKEVRLKNLTADVNGRLRTAELEGREDVMMELIVEKNALRSELEKIRLLRERKSQV